MDTSQKVVSTIGVFQFILFNPSHGSTTNHSTNARAIPTTFPCFNDSHGGERVKVGYYRVGANLMWSESLNQKSGKGFICRHIASRVEGPYLAFDQVFDILELHMFLKKSGNNSLRKCIRASTDRRVEPLLNTCGKKQ